MLKSTVKSHFKSLSAIAKVLGITKSAVSQWPERVPERSAYKLQIRTHGKLRVDTALYEKGARPRA